VKRVLISMEMRSWTVRTGRPTRKESPSHLLGSQLHPNLSGYSYLAQVLSCWEDQCVILLGCLHTQFSLATLLRASSSWPECE